MDRTSNATRKKKKYEKKNQNRAARRNAAAATRKRARDDVDAPREKVVRDDGDSDDGGADESQRGDDDRDGGLSTSYLASLDEGMKRAVKQNRKRAREAQTLLKRAMKVKDVKFFNRLLKDFGNDKQYGFAKEAFERISRAGLTPNVYSYTNILNAATRVGEVEEMRTIWKAMSDAGVEANEVAYTVLVKGESQNGHIDRARSVIREMIDCGVEPNQRTYATLLRNCVRYGDVKNASKCLEMMRERDAAPDATVCEYYIKTLCGELMVQQALDFIRDAQRDGIEVTAQSYVALAVASSLIMPGADVAANACRDARAALDVDAENPSTKASATTRYGDDDVEDPDAPSKSVQLFLQLRAQDASREIEEVEAYMRDVPLARRKQIADKAMKGFDRAPNVRIIGEDEAERPPNIAGDSDVRIEVCSGHGDWITRKAKQDSKIQWIGVEMRRNRVALTWMKALRLGVDANLALVCGMASDAFDARRMPVNTASEVYVNYPDPPEWVGSSQVLVSAEFIRDAHRVLKPGGHLICVTDDSAYAMRMCRELHKARALFIPDHPHVDRPFVSGVPEDYGSSYFDSMWTLGNQRDRYFLRYLANK